MLSASLAAIVVVLHPAGAQTVVGGDGRPAVVVDRSVLDQLGPQPTLPDLLLGRQPAPVATRPVTLHRPHAKAGVALVKPSKSATTTASEASREPKHKAKVAKAKAPKEVAEAAPAMSGEAAATKPAHAAKPKAEAKSGAAKPGKNLASSFEAPPPPHEPKPTVVANADMPEASAPLTPPPTQPEPAAPAKSAAPAKAAKPLTSTVQMNADTANAPAAKPAAETPPAPSAAANTAVPAAPAVPSPPAEAKTETKTAVLTPPPSAALAAEGVVLSVPFAKDSQSLPDDMEPFLVKLAKRVQADPSLQLQVLAYASGEAENASKAQRLSLARALSVRAFLKDQGVPGARIDVRALGNRVPEGPPDRVDLVEQKH